MKDNQTVLKEVRGWLAGAKLASSGRLPPERELASQLGMSRAELRKGLAVLEAEGRVWRHVGKGTFLTEAYDKSQRDVAELADRTSPPEAMEARLVIEPEIARLAAIKATSAQIAEMRQLCREMRDVQNWSEYESLDRRFHNSSRRRAATCCSPSLQHIVNGVRRSVVWGHLVGSGRSAPPGLSPLRRARCDHRCDRGPRPPRGAGCDARTSTAPPRHLTTEPEKPQAVRPSGFRHRDTRRPRPDRRARFRAASVPPPPAGSPPDQYRAARSRRRQHRARPPAR